VVTWGRTAEAERRGALSQVSRLTPSIVRYGLPPDLTHRRRELINLVIAGGTNKEIAARASALSGTRRSNHRATVIRKMGAVSLSQLVHVAIGAATSS